MLGLDPSGSAQTRRGKVHSVLVAQARQLFRADGVEGARDVIDDDSHDEHGDEDVKQHAHLDDPRNLVGDGQAEEVNAVLEDEVADDLGNRLESTDHHEHPHHDRRQRHRNQQTRPKSRGHRKPFGEREGHADERRADQKRRDIADHRFHLAPDLHFADGIEQHPRDCEALEDEHAGRQ